MKKKLFYAVITVLAILTVITSCDFGCDHGNLLTDEAVSATCTAAGLTEGKRCADCGEIVEAQKNVDALGHDYRIETTTATCTSGGYTKYTCQRCADTYTDSETDALGHDYVAVVTAPGCLSDGFTTHTCSLCSDSYTDSETPATGHNHVEATVAPSCSAQGYTSYTCSCGDTYNVNYVPKTSHRFIADKCSLCDMSAPTETIEPNTEWFDEEKTIYTVSTKEELAGLAYLVNSGTCNFVNKTVCLGADIDLEWLEWTPVGNADYAFCGFFNGRGYTVSSLKISGRDSYLGFFGNVGSGGILRDFVIDNASVYAYGTYQYVSIVCGVAVGEITGVTVDGYINAENCSYVGGIVGNSNGTLSVSVCTTSVEITADKYVGGIVGNGYVLSGKRLVHYGDVTGNEYVGGIVGRVTSSGNFELCENYSDVTCGGGFVGGLFGYANGSYATVKDSVSYGNVSGQYYVGGLIGQFFGSLYNSRNEGASVTATGFEANGTNRYVCLGGCVGGGDGVIMGCVNNADIQYDSLGYYVGGIVGDGGVPSDCTNNGNITADHSMYVGGIVGYTNITSFSNCVNNGDISADYANYTGGIVGYTDATSFSNCTNSGDISAPRASYIGGIAGSCKYLSGNDLYNSGNIQGVEYVGGIVGYIDFSQEYSLELPVSNVTNESDISGDKYVGGIVGYLALKNIYRSQLIKAVNITNNGNISGNSETGELFGYFSSTGASTATSYSILGKITINGELLEGEYAVGTNYNLTLSDRIVPEDTTEEI